MSGDEPFQGQEHQASHKTAEAAPLTYRIQGFTYTGPPGREFVPMEPIVLIVGEHPPFHADEVFRELAQRDDCAKLSIKYPNGVVNWARGRGGLRL